MRATVLLFALAACGRLGFDDLAGFGDDGPLPRVAVFAGGRSTCSIVDGFVTCWGDNRSGQLGNGLRTPLSDPQRSVALDGAISFDISDHHACAVRADGKVWCWGIQNDHNELGDHDDGHELPTTTVALPRSAVQVAVGDYHSCALLDNGDVYCWGKNTLGQIGYGPVIVESKAPTRALIDGVAEIRAGGWDTCARKGNGEVWCWGDNGSGQVGIGSLEAGIGTPTKIEGLVATQISVGGDAACAIEAGHYRCWGVFRQLGLLDVTDGSRPQPPSALGGIVDISVGADGTCATATDGSAYCWGNDEFGGLGNDAPFVSAQTPQRVAATGLAHVSSGYEHTCAVQGNDITCWGRGSYGQLGDGRDLGGIPQKLALTGMTEVGVGRGFACARSSTKLYCWGKNSDAQLANGGGDPQSTPLEISIPAQVTSLTVGAQHACVATATIGPRCWGANYSGELGVGDTDFKAGVVAPAIGSQLLVAGDGFTCGITSGGTVRCWGRNDHGQLGDGTEIAQSSPIAAGGLGAIVGLAGGGSHACAFDGTSSWCWGRNDDGQLGVGDVAVHEMPTKLNGPTFATMTAGDYATCGIAGTAGQLYCWGDYYGGGYQTPMPVTGVTGKQVVLGAASLCVVGTSDHLACGGDNEYGQVGDHTYTQSNTTSEVVEVGTVRSVAINDELACAVTLGTGDVWCWGNNDRGQLGRGTMTSSPTPVLVKR